MQPVFLSVFAVAQARALVGDGHEARVID